MKLFRLPLLFAALAIVILARPAAAQAPSGTVELVADASVIAPGKAFTVGIHLRFQPGWYTYWQYPGDSGLAPQVTWTLPPGFEAGPLQWPIPESHLENGEYLTFIYPGEALLLAQVTPPAALPEGPISLSAQVRWLACEKQCVPGQGMAKLELSKAGADAAQVPNAQTAELFTKWRGRLPDESPAPFKTEWMRQAREIAVKISGAPAELQWEFFPIPPSRSGKPGISKAVVDGDAIRVAFPVEKSEGDWRGVLTAKTPDGKLRGWALSIPAAAPAATPSPVAVAPTPSAPPATATATTAELKDSASFPLKDQHALTVRLVSEQTAIAPGKPFKAGVVFLFPEGWHGYWQNPGSTGEPLHVQWILPEGFRVSALEWPLPESHESFGFHAHVYHGEVLLWATITPPAELPEQIVISAVAGGMACDADTCIQSQEATLGLALTRAETPEANAGNATLFAEALKRMPRTDKAPFAQTWETALDVLTLRLSGLDAQARLEIFPVAPATAPKTDAASIEPKTGGDRVVKIPIEHGPWRALVVLGEGANRTGWWISATGEAPKPVASSESAVAEVNHGLDAAGEGWEDEDGVAGGGASVFLMLWLGFLGGLLLNIMPCVLPVIAIKILGFVSQAGSDPKRVFRMGLAFNSGVLVFFWILAGLVIVLGKSFSWGMQFQNPYALTILSALVLIFGLSMLGLFEVELASGAATGLDKLSSKEGYSGAFLHGMFTTLLGTSCTAPLLAPAIGFAVGQPAPIVILLFTAVAVGMAMPYALLTWKPAWLKLMPKPGEWMFRIKQSAGFIMIAVAVWLLTVLGTDRGPAAMGAALWFLTTAAIAAWCFGSFQRSARSAAFSVALLLAGWFFFMHGKIRDKAPTREQPQHAEGIAWEAFSPARVREARKAGKPIFVDFTAEWCINCKVNEGAAIEPAAAAFAAKGVVMLKADFTQEDPTIKAWLGHFKSPGVPLYLVYHPGSPRAVKMDGLLTPGRLQKQLDRIKK